MNISAALDLTTSEEFVGLVSGAGRRGEWVRASLGMFSLVPTVLIGILIGGY